MANPERLRHRRQRARAPTAMAGTNAPDNALNNAPDQRQAQGQPSANPGLDAAGAGRLAHMPGLH